MFFSGGMLLFTELCEFVVRRYLLTGKLQKEKGTR